MGTRITAAANAAALRAIAGECGRRSTTGGTKPPSRAHQPAQWRTSKGRVPSRATPRWAGSGYSSPVASARASERRRLQDVG